MPRSSTAALSPASATDNDLPNVSRPVATVATVGPRPTTSTGSPTRSVPRSIFPVTTVPRPLMVSTFSIGIRNGSPSSRGGTGTYASTASSSSTTDRVHRGSPSRAFSALTRTTGTSSPGKPYSPSSSRTSSSTRSSSSSSSTASLLLSATTRYGTPTR